MYGMPLLRIDKTILTNAILKGDFYLVNKSA